MFWVWFLKYSPLFITGGITLIVGLLLKWLTTRRSQLIWYLIKPQLVVLESPPDQAPTAPINTFTFTLFLSNNGKAPARNVLVGHYFLPAHNVFPDVPRKIIDTPSGGKAIHFPVVPPSTFITISYLYFEGLAVQNIISYVSSDEGLSKEIPVQLQRMWPQWFQGIILVLLLGGLWVSFNAVISLIKFLWVNFYMQ